MDGEGRDWMVGKSMSCTVIFATMFWVVNLQRWSIDCHRTCIFARFGKAHNDITRHGGIRGLVVSCEHGLNRARGLSKCLILLRLLEIGCRCNNSRVAGAPDAGSYADVLQIRFPNSELD